MDAKKWIVIIGHAAYCYADNPTVSTQSTRAGTESGMLALVWYVMTFGALIIFFTFLSCSGGLCRRMPPNQNILPLGTPLGSRRKPPLEKPPAYELFAPPAYETVVGDGSSTSKKPECSVFTITNV